MPIRSEEFLVPLLEYTQRGQNQVGIGAGYDGPHEHHVIGREPPAAQLPQALQLGTRLHEEFHAISRETRRIREPDAFEMLKLVHTDHPETLKK